MPHMFCFMQWSNKSHFLGKFTPAFKISQYRCAAIRTASDKFIVQEAVQLQRFIFCLDIICNLCHYSSTAGASKNDNR